MRVSVSVFEREHSWFIFIMIMIITHDDEQANAATAIIKLGWFW